MSKTAGTLVFVAGLAGLGLWGRADHARDMEATIANNAISATDSAIHDVSVLVSGRDITLVGTADTDAEASALIAAADAVEGRRVVNNELTVLPFASPFITEATKSRDGDYVVSGAIPTEAARAAASESLEGLNLGELELSGGAPEGHADGVISGLKALAMLDEGQLTVEDGVVRLTGEAADEMTFTAVSQTLDDMPLVVATTNEVVFVPVADPYTFVAEKSEDGTTRLVGFIPSEADRTALGEETGLSVAELQIAKGAPDGFMDATRAGLTGIEALDSGMMTIDGTEMNLTGEAPDEATRLAILSGLDAVPENIETSEAVTFVPIASPFVLNAVKDINGATVLSGFVPSETVRDNIGAETGLDVSELKVAKGAPNGFEAATLAGLQELESLDQGTLAIENMTVRLTGLTSDASVEDGAGEALGSVDDFSTSVDIAYEAPVVDTDMVVRFDRVRGLFVRGTSPDGVTAQDVASRLGAPSVQGDLTASGTNGADTIDKPLDALAPFLTEFEEVVLTADADNVRLSGEVLAEADLDQIARRLDETNLFEEIELARAASRFNNGDTRPNPLTGVTETYTDGFWLPNQDIDNATAAVCDENVRTLLQDQQVSFLSASSELDATSRATLASLASIVVTCMQENPALTLMIEGHTDATGSAIGNLRLSRDRASVVRSALEERGAPASRMRADGRGEENPVADNDTEDGRAQNRRTVLIWAE